MTSSNIQAKIKAGLAKAVKKTGSSGSEKVYLVQKVNSGGNTPIDPSSITESNIELVNAIFKSYDKSLIGANIVAGDRQLISDDSVVIKTGYTIRQGSTNYIVISTDIKAPTSDVLVYISQVRQK